MFSERIGVLSDSLVLSGVLGPAAATTLYLTQRLPDLGKSVLFAISGAIWPGLAELNARGETDTFNRRLIELTRLVVILGIAGQVPVIAYNSDFLRRWMGPGYDGGIAIAIAAGFNSVLLTLVACYSSTLVTTGRVSLIAVPALGSAVINVIASVVFSWLFGPVGPLLGTAFGVLSVEAWYVPWQLSKVFGTSRRGLLGAVAIPLLWGVPYAGVVVSLAWSHRPLGWLGLIAEMGICSLMFLVFATFAILTPAERSLWDARLLDPLLRRLKLRGRGSEPEDD
jgi:O-antigen/teichoic acid export membrane protein